MYIKLEIPVNDSAAMLDAANTLRTLAAAMSVTTTVTTAGVPHEDKSPLKVVAPAVVTPPVAAVTTPAVTTPASIEPVVSDLDSEGVPWDARIHGGNRVINANKTWKLLRRPKEYVDEPQWKAYVDLVKQELKNAAPAVSTPTPSVFETPAVVTPPVVAPITPAVVTPPIVPAVVEPVAAVAATAFKDVIQLMTSRKLKGAEVNAICNTYGVDKFIDLKNEDISPEVLDAIYAEMKEL